MIFAIILRIEIGLWWYLHSSNFSWHDYSAIQLMFTKLVIQLVLKQIQNSQYYIEKISIATGWKRVH